MRKDEEEKEKTHHLRRIMSKRVTAPIVSQETNKRLYLRIEELTTELVYPRGKEEPIADEKRRRRRVEVVARDSATT